MNLRPLLPVALLLFSAGPARAQFPEGDRWYQNPLGFKPLNLHTAQGFLVPALAVGVSLLLTEKDRGLTHRLSVHNETGLSWGYKYPRTRLAQNDTGISFRLRRFMSIGVELGAYWPNDDFNRTTGFAVRPFARFYPINNERWRLYFESGGGLIHLNHEFPNPTDRDPRRGTRWNGITKYGLGAEVDIGKSMAAAIGIKHTHVSNGNREGVERNPSHDSNGFLLGFSRRF